MVTRRAYSCFGNVDSSTTSAHSIEPPSIRSSPFKQRSRVVLPLPDAPMIPRTLCGGTANDTPRRMRAPLAFLMRLVTRIMGFPQKWHAHLARDFTGGRPCDSQNQTPSSLCLREASVDLPRLSGHMFRPHSRSVVHIAMD